MANYKFLKDSPLYPKGTVIYPDGKGNYWTQDNKFWVSAAVAEDVNSTSFVIVLNPGDPFWYIDQNTTVQPSSNLTTQEQTAILATSNYFVTQAAAQNALNIILAAAANAPKQ